MGGTRGDADDGKVMYKSKKFHPGHGANFRVFDALDFIAHLAAHIPNRHEKRVIWYGHYSNKSRGMRKKQAALAGEGDPVSQAEIVSATEDMAPIEVRRAWAYLVNKVYQVDPLICTKCGGTMRVISYIEEDDVIWRILNHLGLLEEETVGSSERAPPDGLPPVREITYEPFFDDLPAGEMDEDWLEAVMNVGARN